VDSYLNGIRKLLWLRDGGRQRTTVTTLPDDTHQVTGADFDGRWLTFSVSDEPILDSPWTMYGWDSTTRGPVRTLARSTVPGPYAYPVVVSGKAFWAQAVNDHESQLHMADLASGTQQVIRDGVPGYPFHYATLVAWPEMAPGTDPITLQTADPASGRLVPLPRELNVPLSRPAFENGDADSFVWADHDLKRLQVWHRGAPTPTTILEQAPSGSYLQWPHLSGNILTWDNGSAMFVADLRSGSYAQLTPEAGRTLVAGDGLLVSYAATGARSMHMVQESALVRLHDLPPLPACH
jgi:hypothetical protein